MALKRRNIKFKLWYVLLPISLLAAGFILPPILRSLRNLGKGLGSVADVVGSALSGVSDFAQSALSIFGIGNWVGKEASELALHPPDNLFWSLNFWQSFNAAPDAAGQESNKAVAKLIFEAWHWYGFDEDELIALFQYTEINSQAKMSIINSTFYQEYGQTIPQYWLNGIWLKMSDRRFKVVNDYLIHLPAQHV